MMHFSERTTARARGAGRWRGGLLALTLAVAASATAAPSPRAPEPAVAAVRDDIRDLARAASGVVGVAAWRLDGHGPRIEVNAGERFPMASTFKVAVAGAVLARVDARELDLARMIPVEQERMVESEVLADRFIHPGVALSVYNLLELMLTQSDNTATDVLTGLAGGPAAVTQWLRRQGVADQRVDRDTAQLLRDFFGLPAGVFHEALEQAFKADPALERRGDKPNPPFDDDPRDTTTPAAMAQLLTRIFNGEALSPESTRVLTAIMERCRTGTGRIKGLLPAGTVVAHKTGTIGGSVNDAGVITLPGGAGRVVVAIYVKKSAEPIEQRERAIAEIARSLRDYVLSGARP